MSQRMFFNRSKLLAHGAHSFDRAALASSLASIHGVLCTTLGQTCRVHASLNKKQLPRLCTLREMNESFLCSLLDTYPAKGNQPALNASFHYETRTRVAKGIFNFDHTINSFQISIDMPRRGIPRKHVIALAQSIIEHLDPQWVVYHNRALIDALYRLYPRFFRTAWLSYHTGMDPDLPRWRTLEIVETPRGAMCVAKPRWFGRTDEELLEELIELDALIEDVSAYGW